jgi:hypothetical protein
MNAPFFTDDLNKPLAIAMVGLTGFMPALRS